MSEIKGGPGTNGQSRMDPEVLRRARNRAIGLLAFSDGRPDAGSFPQTREILEALGLDWKQPPEDMVVIGRVSHPDPISVDGMTPRF